MSDDSASSTLPHNVHHLVHLSVGVGSGSVRRVAFLPQELSRAQERSGVFELPAHHIAPLVELERKIAVRSDPLLKGRVHDCLTRGPDRHGLRQVARPAHATAHQHARMRARVEGVRRILQVGGAAARGALQGAGRTHEARTRSW